MTVKQRFNFILFFQSLMQSFNYADITWEHKHDRPILDIKLRESPKGGMSIVTRQVRTPLAICSVGVAPEMNKDYPGLKAINSIVSARLFLLATVNFHKRRRYIYSVMNRFNSYSEEIKHEDRTRYPAFYMFLCGKKTLWLFV